MNESDECVYSVDLYWHVETRCTEHPRDIIRRVAPHATDVESFAVGDCWNFCCPSLTEPLPEGILKSRMSPETWRRLIGAQQRVKL